MDEKPQMSLSEMTIEAAKLSSVLYEDVLKLSKGDLLLAIRSVSYTIGKLVADVPAELRAMTFNAVMVEAKSAEKVIRSVGVDGRAKDTSKPPEARDDRGNKLW